jgi:non-heme Fe2+,alpha-ketoglutarate-dependent halogenase
MQKLKLKVDQKIQDFRLTEDEIKQFHENGFIGPFTLYTEDEIKEIYKEVRAQLFNRDYAPYETSIESALANYDRHLDIDLLSQHICRKEIVERLEGILGKNILCWRSEFIPKRPGAEGTDWHQADTFSHASGKPQLVWPSQDAEGGGCINVWTAFTEATEETGCMLFIPGTQNEAFYDESKGLNYDPEKNNNIIKGEVPRGFNGYDYRELQIDPNWRPDESKAVPMVMKAGEFIIFRSKLLHASKPNTSKTKTRLAYVSRYVPANVKVYPDTEFVEEFGGAYSLDKYGVVEVVGNNLESSNKVKTKNNRGMVFNKPWN